MKMKHTTLERMVTHLIRAKIPVTSKDIRKAVPMSRAQLIKNTAFIRNNLPLVLVNYVGRDNVFRIASPLDEYFTSRKLSLSQTEIFAGVLCRLTKTQCFQDMSSHVSSHVAQKWSCLRPANIDQASLAKRNMAIVHGNQSTGSHVSSHLPANQEPVKVCGDDLENRLHHLITYIVSTGSIPNINKSKLNKISLCNSGLSEAEISFVSGFIFSSLQNPKNCSSSIIRSKVFSGSLILRRPSKPGKTPEQAEKPKLFVLKPVSEPKPNDEGFVSVSELLARCSGTKTAGMPAVDYDLCLKQTKEFFQTKKEAQEAALIGEGFAPIPKLQKPKGRMWTGKKGSKLEEEARQNHHLRYVGNSEFDRDYEFAQVYLNVASRECRTDPILVPLSISMRDKPIFLHSKNYEYFRRARISADICGAEYPHYVMAMIERYDKTPVPKAVYKNRKMSFPHPKNISSEGSRMYYYEWFLRELGPGGNACACVNEWPQFDPKNYTGTEAQIDYYRRMLHHIWFRVKGSAEPCVEMKLCEWIEHGAIPLKFVEDHAHKVLNGEWNKEGPYVLEKYNHAKWKQK